MRWALTFSLGFLAILVSLHEEGQVVSLSAASGEASLDHLGVGEEDPVEGKTGSLDWVFVHFYLLIIL